MKLPTKGKTQKLTINLRIRSEGAFATYEFYNLLSSNSVPLRLYLNYQLLAADFVVSQQTEPILEALLERPVSQEFDGIRLEKAASHQVRQDLCEEILLQVFVLRSSRQSYLELRVRAAHLDVFKGPHNKRVHIREQVLHPRGYFSLDFDAGSIRDVVAVLDGR